MKKLQYFNFIKEDLGTLPYEVKKDERKKGQDSIEIGFEKLNMLYYMISMTQLSLSQSFMYLKLPDFKFNLFDEFSSKRDFSYYTILKLITLGDYDDFKKQLNWKNVKMVALFSDEGRNFINYIIRNDFKNARKEILKILNYLKFDPIMSENIPTLKEKIKTSLLSMFLKAYTRVKISSIADCLILPIDKCKSFLEKEIRDKKLDFKIDEDSQCLFKNSNPRLSYLSVLKHASTLINTKNELISDNILEENLFEKRDHGTGIVKGMAKELFSRIN